MARREADRLQPGDIVARQIMLGGFVPLPLDHLGVLVDAETVVHLTRAGLQTDSLEEFAQGRPVRRAYRPTDPTTTIARATTARRDVAYNAVLWNCATFAAHCAGKKPRR